NLLPAKLLPSPDGPSLQVPGLRPLVYGGWMQRMADGAGSRGVLQKESLRVPEHLEDVQLGIRPEEVQISSKPPAKTSLRIEAVITRIDYLGRAQRLTVRLPSI